MSATFSFSRPASEFADMGQFVNELVYARDLRIDSRYQRSVRKAHVNTIAANFDPYLLDPLVVSRRADGTNYVMDGQHRLLALRQLGYDDQLVPCMVFSGLTLQQESRRFNTQDTRKPLNAVERFRARLLEGQSAEMAVNEVVRASGFAIEFDGNVGPGRLVCVGALLTAYRIGGARHLRDIMTTIAEGFGTALTPDSAMVSGISLFLRRYEGEYEVGRLLEVMRRVTPEQLAREARNLRSAVRLDSKTAYAHTLRDQYNLRRVKNRLPEFAAKSGGR